MTRKPIYSKDQNTRIVSVPCGLWQLQGYDGSKGRGRNREKPRAGHAAQDHYDPWFNRGAPSSKDEAMRHFVIEDQVALKAGAA